MNKIRNLFLCTGNSCRSQMAIRLMIMQVFRATRDEIQIRLKHLYTETIIKQV